MQTANKTNWLVDRLERDYEVQAQLPPGLFVVGQHALQRFIALFGSEPLGQDGRALNNVIQSVIERVTEAIPGLYESEYPVFTNRPELNDGTWVGPRDVEDITRRYIDTLIFDGIKSGRWDKLLANAIERKAKAAAN